MPEKARVSERPLCLLCASSVELCVSVVNSFPAESHHRDTEIHRDGTEGFFFSNDLPACK